MDVAERVRGWATVTTREGLESEERLREPGLFSLEKRRLRQTSSTRTNTSWDGSGGSQALLGGAQTSRLRAGSCPPAAPPQSASAGPANGTGSSSGALPGLPLAPPRGDTLSAAEAGAAAAWCGQGPARPGPGPPASAAVGRGRASAAVTRPSGAVQPPGTPYREARRKPDAHPPSMFLLEKRVACRASFGTRRGDCFQEVKNIRNGLRQSVPK
ncbi:uncharacterized protein [Haliaeetus albicilla]|uniref:uncharacterized protein n=1 Tax=Haliaeetus albicilla TaxID=8969 RepID=UPI0037E7A405